MSMKTRKLLSLIAVLTCFIMVFAACEPVSGVNLNNIFTTSLEQESYEGNAKITLELVPGENPSALGELAGILAFVQGIELDLYEVKQENASTGSFKGNLNFGGFTIPVAASVTVDQVVFQVEGIERPLVIDLTSSFTQLGIEPDLALLTRAESDMNKAIFKYLLPNLPNPNKVNYSTTTIEVNGQQKNVGKLHAELNGTELLELAQLAIRSLAQDEEGLRAFLSEFYDIAAPIFQKVIADLKQDEPEDSHSFEFLQAYLSNKTLVTEFLYTTITQGYKAALWEFGKFTEEIEDPEALDASTLSADIYLDSSLNIIRTEYELKVSMGQDGGAIIINISSDRWNINGDVKADLLDGTNGIDLEGYYVEQEVLSSINPNSLLGQLLSALGYNKKTTYVWLDDYGIYVDNGTTFVSAFEISWYLDVELDWDSLYTDEIVLYDYTGTTVALPLGQNKIIVNGEERSIRRGAFEDEYDYYVPLRAVAEAFGYEVIWDQEFQTIDLIKTYF